MANIVGCRRQPNDEEIIALLNMKELDPDYSVQIINEVDIYKLEPFDLPGLSVIQSDELVWYFFCSPCCKYRNSQCVNRRTDEGYWKITSRDRKILAKHSTQVIGTKKYLTFYKHGYPPKEHKTDWVMHDFHSEYDPSYEKDFVICRIEKKTKNKSKSSTSYDGQSSIDHLASNFRDQVQISGHPHMTHDFGNNFAADTVSRVEHEELADMTSNHTNRIVDNVSGMGEPLLPRFDELCGVIGLYYNSFPTQQSPVCVEDVALSGHSGMDQYSFSIQQLPVRPEQGSSSHPGGFSIDCIVLNSQFESRQVDFNPQWAVQDNYRLQENGHPMFPGLISSKSASSEANFGDSSDTASQTVNTWANGCSPMAAVDYYFDSVYEQRLNSAGEYYY